MVVFWSKHSSAAVDGGSLSQASSAAVYCGFLVEISRSDLSVPI
ncbi:hypothetical protein HanPI659440_Chr06g0229481 [Helianthus annuus]|nr:hypothetical protein HanPI659440_Chr06g0229481 [Helianthus annuus]